MQKPFRIPKEWNTRAHGLFLEGKVQDAVNMALKDAEANPKRLNQAAYYCFVFGDYDHAFMLFKRHLKHSPKDIEILNNVTACCIKLHRYSEAVSHAKQVLLLEPEFFSAFDALAHALGELGDMDGARKAGTKALLLKDRAVTRRARNASLLPEEKDGGILLVPDAEKKVCTFPVGDILLRKIETMRRIPIAVLPPKEEIREILRATDAKKKVCAFSLFGNNPRYLRGALYNVIVGKELYPEWTMRFYVDGTVPHELRDALKGLDAEVLEQEDGQPRDRKLCWRFLVASDPEVGRFMMRDCDSAFSLREALVVDEWLESGELFHVIRDHHAHTDLMLAGLWGGVSGVLSDMQGMLGNFFATARNITSHTDQFFLAEYVWPTIKESCLVHDRIFDAFSPRRPPMKHFRTKNDHIGANRFASDREWQNKCLAPWIRELPCLAVQMTKKG